MFAAFRRAFGAVKIKETATEIHVDGIPADVMQRDLARIFKTSKIAMHMFNTFGKNSFSFYKFFAQDVVFIIDQLIQSRSGVSVRVLNHIRNELFQHTWLKNTLPHAEPTHRLNLANSKRLKKQPLPHQMAFIEHYDTFVDRAGLNGLLADAAAGSGKTLLGLHLAECLDSKYVVVVCPKNALERVWEDTILKEYVKPQSVWLPARGTPYKGQRFILAHYEALAKVIEQIDAGKIPPDNVTVLLDESHNLNDIKSQRTQLFIELCTKLKSRNVIPGSGTPVKAMGAELIPLLKVLDPYFTDGVQERFKKIYGKDGSKGLEILRNRLGLISYRIEKSVLNLDKPVMIPLPIKMPTAEQYTLPAIRKVMEDFIKERVAYYKGRRKEDERFWERCLDLHEKSLKTSAAKDEYKRYRGVLKKISGTVDPRFIGEEIAFSNLYERRHFEPTLPKEMVKPFREVKSIIKYTQLKIQGECLGRILGRKRIECHVEMARYVDYVTIVESTLKKTVVFTSFVEALVAVNDQCSKLGLKPLAVYGKTNNELASIVKRFEQDESLNPLSATYNSLSTAVPLVMADTMIMLNAPFRAYIQEQAISRIHRLGATTQTTIYLAHLDTGDTPNISTRSSEILAWSQEQVEAITGLKSPFAITESLEGFASEVDGFDDAGVFGAMLLRHYGQLGMDIDQEPSFDLGIRSPAPHFMQW